MIKKIFVSLLNVLLKPLSLSVISDEHKENLEKHGAYAVRAMECHRWYGEFDAYLKPMWDYIAGRGGVDISPHRDHFKRKIKEHQKNSSL